MIFTLWPERFVDCLSESGCTHSSVRYGIGQENRRKIRCGEIQDSGGDRGRIGAQGITTNQLITWVPNELLVSLLHVAMRLAGSRDRKQILDQIKKNNKSDLPFNRFN